MVEILLFFRTTKAPRKPLGVVVVDSAFHNEEFKSRRVQNGSAAFHGGVTTAQAAAGSAFIGPRMHANSIAFSSGVEEKRRSGRRRYLHTSEA
jgi:hypothetical protein